MITLRESLKSVSKKRVTINEEKIRKNDIDEIYRLIEYPKNKVITLSSYMNYTADERIVTIIRKANGVVLFKYNLDFDDFTTKLVEICDNLGFKFVTQIDKSLNTMVFEIVK